MYFLISNIHFQRIYFLNSLMDFVIRGFFSIPPPHRESIIDIFTILEPHEYKNEILLFTILEPHEYKTEILQFPFFRPMNKTHYY